MPSSGRLPQITQGRMIAIIVPVAALLGTAVALAFSTFDKSTSQVPAFQADVARQSAAGATANHGPRWVRREQRPARKRKRRRAVPAAAAVSAPALQPQAGTTLPREAAVGAPTQTGVQSPVTTPTPSPSPPVARPAPKPKPTPTRRPSGGGGGGSFDDSG
jgi:hypothetical protein